MKKKSLDVLYRYRHHLLEREQINLQDKIAEENQQKARLLQLQSRVHATHEAKAAAGSVEELRALDDAAAYLHGRMTLARRAITLTAQAREEALEQTIRTKRERDQVQRLIETGKLKVRQAEHETERKQLDELVTSRHALAFEAL